MKKVLEYEINRTLTHYGHGTYHSRTEKRNILRQIIKDLLDLKIAPPTFKQLTLEKITALVSYWQKNGNSAATIMNKLSGLRTFSIKGGFDIPVPSNISLGLNKARSRKSPFLPVDIVTQVSSPITEIILQLQMEFGLTKHEAVKIRPADAINQGDLTINKGVAYNHNDRFVAIYRPSQKEAVKKWYEVLQEHPCLSELATEQHIINLYNSELAVQGVDFTANFRVVYGNNRLIELERKKIVKKEAYKILISEMGYCSKQALLEAIL